MGKNAKPGSVTLVLGFLLMLEPGAITVVTRSHGESRNFYLYGNHKSLCRIDSGNYITKSHHNSSPFLTPIRFFKKMDGEANQRSNLHFLVGNCSR